MVLAGATGRQKGKSDLVHLRGKKGKKRYSLRVAKKRGQEEALIGNYTRE